ncbi:MAG: glycoside hydrolase [Gammaproteobacteria bacterium]|nr:glycoside hydrolase [Gammaproteobacteria bacterium]
MSMKYFHPLTISLGVAFSLAALLSACGSDTPPPAPTPPPVASEPDPVVFHCSKDSTCPEILIAGDPHAESGGSPAFFRGYGDPSLEYDPTSGVLWLAYSWLDPGVVITGPPAQPDLLVRTHLARSFDNGTTFEFVRAINETTLIDHPDSSEQGWLIHEISTIALQPDGNWQTLWLQYFDPVGTRERYDFQFNRSDASSASSLGDTQQGWARTALTTPSFGATLRFDGIPEVAGCTVHTEPALFAHQGTLYLATHCLVMDSNGRRPDRESIVLLRDNGGNYEFVGTLLAHGDYAGLGGEVITQPDLSVSRDGTILLTITPKNLGADPQHQGCVVLAVEDITGGRVARDSNNQPVRRAVITADGNGLGPGLCTYDPTSNSGVMLVITTVADSPLDIEFSLRATGIHP